MSRPWQVQVYLGKSKCAFALGRTGDVPASQRPHSTSVYIMGMVDDKVLSRARLFSGEFVYITASP